MTHKTMMCPSKKNLHTIQRHFLKHKVVLISLTPYSKFVTIRLYLQKLKTINRKQKYIKIDRQTTISFLDPKNIEYKY